MGRFRAVAVVAVAVIALGPVGVLASGTSWAIQATPNPSGGGLLSGVSCTSATACTAVGYYLISGFTPVPLAERWNGTSWAIQATPNPSGAHKDSFLSGVSCTSATACTAVGGYTNSGFTRVPLAERWNGTSWAIQATPNPSGAQDSFLSGVSCTSTTACIAVGYYASGSSEVTLAERWNGTSWAIQATPNPIGARASFLSGVSCTSAARQRGQLAHPSQGAAGRLDRRARPGGLGPAGPRQPALRATACTAVGSYLSGRTWVLLAERWNGTSWAIQATPNPSGAHKDSSLTGVSCTSTTACTAVGGYLNSGFTYVTLAERWNGTSWAIQATPNPSGAYKDSSLTGMSCTSATACTAVGGYTNSGVTGVTLAERWNGTSWAIQATPNPSGVKASSLIGVSCTSATACTAVGYYLTSGYTYVTLAER
jgi:hypothetical protein